MHVTVDCDTDEGTLEHFWRGTGFTPAEWLLDEDMRQSMTYLGSIPNDGLLHVRIHYLLDLVRVTDLDAESVTYDWRDLDDALDALVQAGLKPFFELMGNPSEHFSDFTDDGDLRAWRRMVHDVVDHLVDRYGREEVESWYFETWNEPDAGFGWEQFRWDADAFCNYYDACAAGLHASAADVEFGGPGFAALATPPEEKPLFVEFLRHCEDGEEYFTGGTPHAPDFISVHEKGVRADGEDLSPDSAGIVDREFAHVNYVREHHPTFADVPIMNNECDPQTGWGNTHTWRAHSYYAAIVAKIVDQHLALPDAGVEYALLSNDNGFLGSWGQRTHFVQFGDDDRDRGAFELVKKPAHNAMTMLSLLGDTRIEATVRNAPGHAGVLATVRDGEQIAVLLYHSADEIGQSGTEPVDVTLEDVPFETGAVAHYRIDADHGDPFHVWTEMGDAYTRGPRDLSADQLSTLRRHQELALLDDPRPTTVDGGTISLDFDLPLPGVSLVLASADPDGPPGQVEGLRCSSHRGLTVDETVLFSWNDLPERTVRSYEVLAASDLDGPYERVNEVDLLATAFRHSLADGERYFRVRAVDYWGRMGECSSTLEMAR